MRKNLSVYYLMARAWALGAQAQGMDSETLRDAATSQRLLRDIDQLCSDNDVSLADLYAAHVTLNQRVLPPTSAHKEQAS